MLAIVSMLKLFACASNMPVIADANKNTVVENKIVNIPITAPKIIPEINPTFNLVAFFTFENGKYFVAKFPVITGNIIERSMRKNCANNIS